MTTAPRYTDEHAKAGLDFSFPAHRDLAKPVSGYEIQIDDPAAHLRLPQDRPARLRHAHHPLHAARPLFELKSLKEYLFSYRNLGIFQENIVNQVLGDIVKACDPVWAVVKGEFRPRGGIGTTVEARWPRPVG